MEVLAYHQPAIVESLPHSVGGVDQPNLRDSHCLQIVQSLENPADAVVGAPYLEGRYRRSHRRRGFLGKIETLVLPFRRSMSNELRNFLTLTYEELEEKNLAAKEQRKNRVPIDKIQEERIKYLTDEKRIKAVTVLFSDLEGRLHMLDYDKKFLVKSWDNLTFDGSSIRGFTAQKESDLRLGIDWSAFYWVPADVLGSGKVFVFGQVIDKQGGPYAGDLRSVLKAYADKLYAEKGYTLNAANEIEGFLFAGKRRRAALSPDWALRLREHRRLLPLLAGRPAADFIDTAAEVQRALGFENEKDHPEVAPSQFEINYSYGEVVAAADQIQLYKLLCRQIATGLGFTASFLPKPVVGVNGSGMHTNMSITKDGKNLFWDAEGTGAVEHVRMGVHRPHS
jgi:glutamine synthetase